VDAAARDTVDQILARLWFDDQRSAPTAAPGRDFDLAIFLFLTHRGVLLCLDELPNDRSAWAIALLSVLTIDDRRWTMDDGVVVYRQQNQQRMSAILA
jgi:hypothetical protein